MSRKSRISAEDFVKLWQKAKTIDEVVKVTKTTRSAAVQRASMYRRKKIPLKNFPPVRTGAPLDVEALAKLAKSTPTSKPTVAAKTAKAKPKAKPVVKSSKKVARKKMIKKSAAKKAKTPNSVEHKLTETQATAAA